MGQFDSFVDDCGDWRRRVGEQFPYCKAKDVPVNDGECVDGVLRRCILDMGIQLVLPGGHTVEQIPAVGARTFLGDAFVSNRGFGQVAFEDIDRGVVGSLGFVQRFEGELACSAHWVLAHAITIPPST